MLPNLLSRDDIFISYSRGDGGLYAAGLADRLTEKKYSCFIDKLGTEPDKDLPESLKKKIRNCTLFVLVGTERGTASEFVGKEIAEFKKTKRTIVPIDFGGAVGRARWYDLIPGLAAEPEENLNALKTGEPSANVISRIEKSFNYSRRNQRMLRILVITTAVFLVLLLASAVAAFVATKKINEVKKMTAIAEEQMARNRHMLYASNIKVAQQAYETGNLPLGQQLLSSYLSPQQPDTQPEDFRGFEFYYLWRLYHSELATLKDNSFLAFSPDGQTLLTSTRDKSLSWWNVNSAQQTASQNHKGPQGAEDAEVVMAYSPDGQTIAVATGGDSVILFDGSMQNKKGEIKLLASSNEACQPEYVKFVSAMAFSPDAKTLVIDHGANISLWDTSLRQFQKSSLCTYVPASHSYNSLAFSPDKKLLAFTRNEVMLLDTTTGTTVELPNTHEGPVTAVAISPDGRTIATGSEDNTARIWSAASRGELGTLKGHKDFVLAVAFSRDGKIIATASADRTVKLWEVASRRELTTLKGHTAAVTSVAFSPDGKVIATSSENELKLWSTSLAERAPFKELTDQYARMRFLNDGKSLAILPASANEVKLLDTNTLTERSFKLSHTDIINALALSRDGRFIATGSSDRTAKIWDLSTQTSVALQHSAAVNAVDFSPDGKILATSLEDMTVRLWDIGSQRELATLKHEKPISLLLFSRDGQFVVAVSGDATIKLWSVETRREIATLDDSGKVVDIVFSPDSKTLVTVSESNDDEELSMTVKLWDVSSRQELASFACKDCKDDFQFAQGGLSSLVEFSPDGRTVAVAGENSLKLWSLAERREISTLRGHDLRVNAVAFSPDGKTIATGSSDKTVRLWDVASQQEMVTLRHEDSPVESEASRGQQDIVLYVGFSPDGRTLVSNSVNGVWRLWYAASGDEVVAQSK